jgi:DNA-binding Lrp family transcriptional regulator
MKISPDKVKMLDLSKSDILILKELNRNPLPIADLAVSTNIPRTSLYYMLSKLQARGLVKKIRENKKSIWNLLDSSLFEEVSTENISPQIKIYKGTDKLLNVFWEIAEIPPKSRFYGIQPKSSIVEAINKSSLEEIIRFNDLVKKKDLIVEGVIHEKGTSEMLKSLSEENKRKLLESFGGRSADTVKLPSNYLENTKAEMYMYQGKLAIMNWKEEFAVVIKNKDVFELFMEMFKSTKYLLKKYDQNEKIAKMRVDEK